MNFEFSHDQRAALARNMQPTPAAEHAYKQSQFPASIEIGMGVEREAMNARFSGQQLAARTSVGQDAGFDVQVDNSVFTDETYPEHAQKHKFSWPAMRPDVVQGAVGFDDRMFECRFLRRKSATTMGELLPGVKREYANLGVRFTGWLPIDSLQATSGVGEANVPTMYRRLVSDLGVTSQKLFNDLADEVLAYVQNRLRKLDPEVQEFSPDVYGFLWQVAMLAVEGALRPHVDGKSHIPKAQFMFNLRTALSWRYCNNLLTEEDRKPVKGILLKAGDRPTLMNEAITHVLNSITDEDLIGVVNSALKTDRFFSIPYLGPVKADGSRDLFKGPTRDEVFESIVKDVYDLICNLEGWSGQNEISKWVSGDLDFHLAGMELHSIGFKPGGNVLEATIKALYAFWSRLNPRLEQLESLGLHDTQEWKACRDMAKAVKAVDRLCTVFDQVKAEHGQEAGAYFVEHIVREGRMEESLDDLYEIIEPMEDLPEWDAVYTAYEALDDHLQGEPADADTDVMEEQLVKLGRALYECDTEGSGRRERQAKFLAESGR